MKMMKSNKKSKFRVKLDLELNRGYHANLERYEKLFRTITFESEGTILQEIENYSYNNQLEEKAFKELAMIIKGDYFLDLSVESKISIEVKVIKLLANISRLFYLMRYEEALESYNHFRKLKINNKMVKLCFLVFKLKAYVYQGDKLNLYRSLGELKEYEKVDPRVSLYYDCLKNYIDDNEAFDHLEEQVFKMHYPSKFGILKEMYEIKDSERLEYYINTEFKRTNYEMRYLFQVLAYITLDVDDRRNMSLRHLDSLSYIENERLRNFYYLAFYYYAKQNNFSRFDKMLVNEKKQEFEK